MQLNHALEWLLQLCALIESADKRYKQSGQYPTFQGSDMYNLPECFKQLDESIASIKALCEELNLNSGLEHIKRLQDERPHLEERFGRLADLIREVRQRVEDDLKIVYFLHVPAAKVEYYDKPIFGKKVEDRFSDSIDDIREAGNCYALGRWTGVVHHCMGIVQCGLMAVASHFGSQIDIYLHDWNTIITKIEGEVAAKRKIATSPTATNDQKSEWRKIEPIYSEIISDARAMKDAWRNPTAHFRRQYDEAQAKKVLEKVGDFMRNLAINLPS